MSPVFPDMPVKEHIGGIGITAAIPNLQQRSSAMKVLITGATGFIGSQLALEARAAGHEVVISGLVTNSAERDRCERLARAGLLLVDGSLRIPAFAQRIVKGCDAVIHLAAARSCAMSDDYYFDTNVEATRLLLEGCVRHGVRSFVFASTTDVYPSVRDRALSEDSAVATDRVESSSKLAAEELVRLFGDRLQVSIARIGETYGPEDFQLLKLLSLIERGVVPEVGSGENLHQPIHVHDVARGLLRMVDHPEAAGETFLLVGPAPISTRSIIDACALAMDCRVHRTRVPLLALTAAAAITNTLRRRFEVEAGLDSRSIEFFASSRWFASDKAKTLLHFEPAISFESGVHDIVNWYRQMGYLIPRQASVRAVQTVRSASDIPLDAMSGSKWQLSEVFESTCEAIIVWEMRGHGILYWNSAAEELYGFTRAEAQGRMTHSLLATRVDGGIDELESKVSRYGGWAGRLTHRKKDNTEIVIDALLTTLSHQDGRALVLEVNRPIAHAPKTMQTKLEGPVLEHDAEVQVGVSAA
jgi:PAS domain S-box-containing protein